jgi:DNA-binding response OmpR family regulator
VIMLTASDDLRLNRKAYEAGARACVTKPFRAEGLNAALKSVLAVRTKPEQTA